MVAQDIQVLVLHAPVPRQVQTYVLRLGRGATVREALSACGMSIVQQDEGAVGIWGRRVSLDHVLRDGDRVEVCRALLVDPKIARRERFRRQGSRAAGLFANRRPGAKPGY